MGKMIGSLLGIKAPDTSAQEAQIAEQRKQIEEDRAIAQAETRDEAEKFFEMYKESFKFAR